MRIGVDLLGVQDANALGRGIGRYVERFIDALVRADPANEYLLYFFDCLKLARGAFGSAAALRAIPWRSGPLVDAVQGFVDHNPDRLDLYLVTNPFSMVEGYRPPVKPVGGPRMASILYDLTPMALNLDFYLNDFPGRREDYFERIARLRDYDLILAISEATRADATAWLGLPGRRVVNISSATREGFFAPPASGDLPPGLAALGVRKPYVLGAASAEPHKNTAGLVRAFAALPAEVRAAHQLVLVGGLEIDAGRELSEFASRHGVGDRLIAAGRLPDERLREAYQHCGAFAFFSHYEGFGLPILEAMLCAAPVVAGANSSQVEVVGDAGLTADTENEADMAGKLGLVLVNSAMAADLRSRGPRQARKFSWAETARRTREALTALPPRRCVKPLLAFVAPLPPQRSAAARHAQTVLQQLRPYYTIHLYHESMQAPHAALADSAIAAFDCRLFERHMRVWNYAAVLYQLDGAAQPCYVRELILRHPGVVLIHPGDEVNGGAPLADVALAPLVIVPDGSAADRLRPICGERICVLPPGSAGERYAAVIDAAVGGGRLSA